MADDDLIFADSADGAMRKKKRPPEPSRGKRPPQPQPPQKRRPPAHNDPMNRTRPVAPMRSKTPPPQPTGPRRPPPRDVAMRPHVLVSPVLSEPLLLSRSKKHVVGREEGVEIRIKTDRVSRKHAEIFWDGTCFVVVDLNSTNGSLLNGRPLKPSVPTPLKDDDNLDFGGYVLQVNILKPGQLPEEDSGGVTRKMKRRP